MLWDVLGICRLCAGDLGHSRSVSRRVRSIFFQLELIISSDLQEFINTSLAQNNAALLGQIFKLVADSAENVKRSSVEDADEQLREIKRLRREEPKSFKRKGNEIQYKFNSKLQDTLEEAKSHLEVNAVEKVKASLSEGTTLLSERQKLILLADKSEFGWKTVQEYTQHELADSEEDCKKIRRAEERAEKALNSAVSKKSVKRSISARRTSTLQYGPQNSRGFSALGSWRNPNERLPRTPSSFPSRNGNCFACGKFDHWRSKYPQTQRSGSKGNLLGNR